MSSPRLTGLTGLDARDGAARLPRLRLVAVARRRREVDKDALDGAGRGRVRRLRHRLLRRRRARCSACSSTGPAPLFPHAYELPAGPPSDDAMLVTCAYITDSSSPWVLQSLFLAAIGEARDRGAASIEAFACRYPEGESAHERFRAQDGLPGRLPRRLRLPGRAQRRADRARAARARRARSRSWRAAASGCCASSRRRSCPSRCPRRAPERGRGGRRPRARLGGEHELGDLDRVQRGALAQVVAREDEREAALDRRVAADPPDEHLVDPGRLAGRGELLEPDRRRGARAARAPARA